MRVAFTKKMEKRAYDRAMQQWNELRAGEHLVFVWPSPKGQVEAA